MLRLFVSLFFVFALNLNAKAQTCDVPVCDIAAQITDLKAKNGDQRGMYAINLKAQYKDSQDVAVLENLRALGLEMKSLFINLKDEDWVVRAASDLVNTVVLNLAKYSSVNGSELVKYYRELDGQASRYALILYWQNQLVNIENVSELNSLINFASGARERSTEVNDEDWVSRAATSLITEITIKLTALDPAHEGLYNVKMTEASRALGTLDFDKMAVLDSSSNKNLMIVLINSRLRVTVYSFSNAEIKGNEVTGLFLSNGQISQKISFVLDRNSGSVSGTIESTKSDVIEFNGTQAFSTRTVFAGRSSREVTEADVLGKLNGEIAGIKGVLAIKSFLPNVYSATFTSENGSIVMSFQGKFFPKSGVISLTSGEKIKLVISLREKNGEEMWSGYSFSTINGSMSQSSFKPIK
ncbi:MAG: hypothetical protein K2P81_06835 [Bacteriovoracaceae bacterium]|nr:hypothetical protein [Bacteriovoracaceae bacterium]